MERGGMTAEQKVMVAVNPTRESAAALQYVSAHAVVENFVNPNFWRNTISFLTTLAEGGGGAGAGDVDFLAAMKYACQIAQPNARLHVEKVETDGKDKATVILSWSTERGVDLLVVGKRQSIIQRNFKAEGERVAQRTGHDRLLDREQLMHLRCNAEKGPKCRLSSQHKNSQEFLALSFNK